MTKSIYQTEFEQNIGYADELLDCLLDDFDFITFVHQLPSYSEGCPSCPPKYFSDDAFLAITDLAMGSTRKLYLRTLRAFMGILAWRLLNSFTDAPEELIVELKKLVDSGGLAFSELQNLTKKDIQSEITAAIEGKDVKKCAWSLAWSHRFMCANIGKNETI